MGLIPSQQIIHAEWEDEYTVDHALFGQRSTAETQPDATIIDTPEKDSWEYLTDIGSIMNEVVRFTVDLCTIESNLPQGYNFNLSDMSKYQGWIKETVAHSKRTGQNAIIIDKADYRLELYQKGQLVKSFPVELGKNPFDDKLYEGDSTTPEGKYHVSKVKDVGRTSFYRALLVSYPSREDRRETTTAIKEGKIPNGTSPGGAIEIHGKGSGISPLDGGRNWTAGCIALSNAQMDELFPYVNERTPVTIVKYDSHSRDATIMMDSLTLTAK